MPSRCSCSGWSRCSSGSPSWRSGRSIGATARPSPDCHARSGLTPTHPTYKIAIVAELNTRRVGSGVMEMSVKAGGQAVLVEQPKNKSEPSERRNASDLDLWLEKVEARGELKRITAEVDPNLEAATIT